MKISRPADTRVLARTADAGVDTFVKEGKSLFVFFQGHPEYDADTLLREYRRDVERYLRHETSVHPSIPRGYFDHTTERALAALREKAMSGPDGELPRPSPSCSQDQRNREYMAHNGGAHL